MSSPGYIIVSVLTLAACFGCSQMQSRCHAEGFRNSKWKVGGGSSMVSLTEQGILHANPLHSKDCVSGLVHTNLARAFLRR